MRLWRNECERVFCDRLIDEEDVVITKNLIKEITNENFNKECVEDVLKDPLILVNFMKSEPLDPEV